MRKLTIKEIEKFASRKGVRRIATENFLMSMGTIYKHAIGNLLLDTASYGWNSATYKAIKDGIKLAKKEIKK